MSKFKPGDRVRHTRWDDMGIGTVVQGSFAPLVSVRFDDYPSYRSSTDYHYTREEHLVPVVVQPKVGDRVRVVLEGVISDDTCTPGSFTVGDGSFRNIVDPKADHVVSVEILEPEWREGDVALDASRQVNERTPSGSRFKRRCGKPELPLTLLVRDGKKVDG